MRILQKFRVRVHLSKKQFGTYIKLTSAAPKKRVSKWILRYVREIKDRGGLGPATNGAELHYSLCHLDIFAAGEARHEACHRVSCQSDVVLHLFPRRRNTTGGRGTVVTLAG